MFLSPLSSPLLAEGGSNHAIQVPAPSWFKPPKGRINQVSVNLTREYSRGKGNSAAKMAGLRYEAHVQKALVDLLVEYVPSPLVQFFDDSGVHHCEPDGIYLPPASEDVFIFEIKISHMPDAWWQLERKYKPILQAWRPQASIRCIEIVRTFDSSVPFPCQFEFIPHVEGLLNFLTVSRRHDFGVFQWRP